MSVFSKTPRSVGVLLIVAGFVLLGALTLKPKESSPVVNENRTPPSGVEAEVVRVVDGDTLLVRVKGGETEPVRLIGIDAPEFNWETREHECFAFESAERLRELAPNGATVFLERDESQGERDSYDRILSYALLPGGTNIGEELLRGGYAREFTFREPYTLRDVFRAAQGTAQRRVLGLWSVCQ